MTDPVPGGARSSRLDARLSARLEAARRRLPGWLLPVLRAAALVTVVAVVADLGARNYGSVRHLHLTLRPAWLAAAAPASLLAGLLMPMGWRMLLVAYDQVLGVGPALRIWWTAQITRYVPTGTAALATRVVLAGRAGVPRWLAGASLPIEVGAIVAWGGVFTAALLPSTYLPSWARVLVGVGSGGVLLAFPMLLRLAGGVVPRLPAPAPGGAPAVYRSLVLYGLNTATRTASFAFLAHAIVGVGWGDVALLMGAWNAGSVAGLVSIAPGGLGVREGVMTLILRARYGFGDAAALAVVLRAWDLCIDVAWLAAARVAGARTG